MKTSFGLKLDSLTHKTSVVCFEFLQFRNVKRQKYKVIDKYFNKNEHVLHNYKKNIFSGGVLDYFFKNNSGYLNVGISWH